MPLLTASGMERQQFQNHNGTQCSVIVPFATTSSARCSLCRKFFSSNSTLRRHFVTQHTDANVAKMPPLQQRKDVITSQIQCSTCTKSFSCHSTLRRHVKRIHNENICLPVNVGIDADKLSSTPVLSNIAAVTSSESKRVHNENICLSVNVRIDADKLSSTPVLSNIAAVTSSETIATGDTASLVLGVTTATSVIDSHLLQLLPTGNEYKYLMKSFDRDALSVHAFTTVFKVNLSNREKVRQWLKNFERKSKAQFNVINRHDCKGRLVHLKTRFKCVHNVKGGKLGVGKHTGCLARMKVTISVMRASKSSVIAENEMCCEIELRWAHNHPLVSADALRRHTVSEETDQKLEHLYRHGHGPESARKCIIMEIQDNVEEDEDIEQKLADRSLCPDYKHCHYMFKKLLIQDYGEPQSNDKLLDFIREMNENGSDEVSIAREQYQNVSLIAICTPFMKRVHNYIHESGELVFVDSSGGMDRDNYRIFLLMTHSKAGGLPLAVGITPSESVEALTRLFNLMKTVLPEYAFCRRGKDQGPQCFMTDDCAAEQISLSNVWPGSRHFLCQFHILQAQWRWLQLSSHRIEARDRPYLFAHIKKLMYAATEHELTAQYEMFSQDPVVTKYNAFREQISSVFSKKAKWCTALSYGALLRGNYTNNYVEAAMRILKDHVFRRTRAFNPVQLMHFIVERFSAYYERRCMDFASNRLQRSSEKFPDNEGSAINALSDDVFEVASSSCPGVVHTVNTSTTICTCRRGSTGRMCKHLHWVISQEARQNENQNSATSNYHVNDCRQLMYLVSCGHSEPEGWLSTLHGGVSAMKQAEPQSEQAAHSIVSDGNLPTSLSSDELAEENEKKVAEFVELFKLKIGDCASENQQGFSEAIKSAINTLKTINTPNAGLSALRTFGKYGGGGAVSLKRLNRSSIPVQTTAYARRKKVLRGRGPGEAGRPRKSAIAETMHDYAMRGARNHPARHRLSFCAERNISLGKTHSKK